MNPTDQELVRAALSDKQAFRAIVERYEAPMRRYIRRLGCSDQGDVEDILQDIFIKVFINLNDYDASLAFSSWLYRIAHNETISLFRKKSVRPSVVPLSTEDAEQFFAHLSDGEDALASAHERDDARRVQDQLAHLQPKYREALVLRFLEEKSYTEIGDILKIPEGTVATLISRGKKELRRLLEAKGISL